MRVREATLRDAKGIAKVHVDSWKTTYAGIVSDDYLDTLSIEERENRWVSILSKEHNEDFTFVAEEDRTIVAFASGGPEREGNQDFKGELYAIYILASHQGKGIGKALLHTTVEALLNKGITSMLIWVLADNPSRYFYERMGGIPVQEQEITIGGVSFQEVAYGWHDISTIKELH